MGRRLAGCKPSGRSVGRSDGSGLISRVTADGAAVTTIVQPPKNALVVEGVSAGQRCDSTATGEQLEADDTRG